LTFASYFFYGWWQFDGWSDFVHSLNIRNLHDLGNSLWHWRFTIIMLSTSSIDYWAANRIVRAPVQAKMRRAVLLALSLTANLGLLGFFKYFGFCSQVADDLVRFLGGGSLPVYSLILPVGISFYTFESISYVIDVYRGVAAPAKSYLDYACFISFFPHLVAGPIIRYSDILHQFRDAQWVRRGPDWSQVDLGILFFTIGMTKKILIADPLAVRINPLWDAFSADVPLGMAGSWAAVLGYTFRIYFDFSGYSDMAIGLGHLFGVRLPQNFNSPYKASDPIDFWRRWHISLSTWLRDYLYIPLGGNRNGKQFRNLMITMLLGGLWHGAAWLFVIWGGWHGLLLVLTHAARNRGIFPSKAGPAGYWIGRLMTFLLVSIGWVFFRAADVKAGAYGPTSVLPAFRMLGQMAGSAGVRPVHDLAPVTPALVALIVASWAWCNFAPNSNEVVYNLEPRNWHAVLAGAIMAICFCELGGGADFLYFRF
jgi:alginate O-acetyltransferase complex protein AlgI